MSGKPVILVAAAALIDSAGRVLLAQRPSGKSMAGLWEFPGGKVEPGESPEHALVRELHEELGITVEPADLIPLTFASHAYEAFHLLMPVYVCRTWTGDVHPHENQAMAWTDAPHLNDYAMPPADLPLLADIVRAMSKTNVRVAPAATA